MNSFRESKTSYAFSLQQWGRTRHRLPVRALSVQPQLQGEWGRRERPLYLWNNAPSSNIHHRIWRRSFPVTYYVRATDKKNKRARVLFIVTKEDHDGGENTTREWRAGSRAIKSTGCKQADPKRISPFRWVPLPRSFFNPQLDFQIPSLTLTKNRRWSKRAFGRGGREAKITVGHCTRKPERKR